MTGGRDSEVERQLLDGVERTSGAAVGFSDLVRARLDDGDRTHAGSFMDREIVDLLMEAAEEALDLVGWSALALTVAERTVPPDDRARQPLRAELQTAAALSAAAFGHLNTAISSLTAPEAQEEGRAEVLP